MTGEVATGILISCWVALVVPAFLLATFTRQSHRWHDPAVRMMGAWVGGFAVVMALYALDLGFTVAAMWSGIFAAGTAAWFYTRRRAAN